MPVTTPQSPPQPGVEAPTTSSVSTPNDELAPKKKTRPPNQILAMMVADLRRFKGNLIYVEDTDCFYLFDGKYYKPLSLRELHTEIYSYLLLAIPDANITDNLIKDLVKHLVYGSPSVPSIVKEGAGVIAFDDGMINTSIIQEDGRFTVLNKVDKRSFPTLYLPFKLDAVRSAQCPQFMEYLRTTLVLEDTLEHDPTLATVVQEMFGYFLLDGTKAAAAFFLVGVGSNGKSVLADIITSMFGLSFVSSLSLETLTTDRFASSSLVGKRVNICSEEESLRTRADKFKAMVSGDLIQAERKYGSSFSFRPQVKFLFCSNKMPVFDSMNYGLRRRIHMIPFHRTFLPDEKDIYLTEKLMGEMPGIIAWALAGAKRLIENRFVFSDHTSPSITKIMDEFVENSSPVTAFFREFYTAEVQRDEAMRGFVPISIMYQDYVAWCGRNGRRHMNAHNFSHELTNSLGVKPVMKHVDGKTVRGRYVKRVADVLHPIPGMVGAPYSPFDSPLGYK